MTVVQQSPLTANPSLEIPSPHEPQSSLSSYATLPHNHSTINADSSQDYHIRRTTTVADQLEDTILLLLGICCICLIECDGRSIGRKQPGRSIGRSLGFDKLNLTNCVLLTGGFAKSSSYLDRVTQIFENSELLEPCDALNLPSTLQFMSSTDLADLSMKMTLENLAMQNHKHCISLERFLKTKELTDFFHVLQISNDRKGLTYVSTIQASRFPIFVFQWHPEKTTFKWGNPAIPHSEDAIRVSQFLENFFIRETRKSNNLHDEKRILEHVIYNHSPVFCGKYGRCYDEVYHFIPLPSSSSKEVIKQKRGYDQVDQTIIDQGLIK
ncbi:hypothetical protein ACFE04_030608 [Oxalis oulophora]